MRGVYTLATTIADILSGWNTPSNPRTLILFRADANHCYEVLGADITNASQNLNEQIHGAVRRVQSASYGTPAGTTLSNQGKAEDGDSAMLGTKLAVLTTEPSAYEDPPLNGKGVPSLGGYHYEPVPEERQIISPGDGVGVVLMVAPTATFKAVVNLRLRAIGG